MGDPYFNTIRDVKWFSQPVQVEKSVGDGMSMTTSSRRKVRFCRMARARGKLANFSCCELIDLIIAKFRLRKVMIGRGRIPTGSKSSILSRGCNGKSDPIVTKILAANFFDRHSVTMPNFRDRS